ncbi:hypothetical protein LTR84_002674 [Exophiala bonariae]|uniref:Alpha/beta hydrolase fold-3 domain-containing protein n=1 Tax=Exophiala bonariae TaxID=1690606 RepID=A0AAV9N9C8_9EURO|nr:hypothetical protein LTR84_002674 [Exophiala bonariae]
MSNPEYIASVFWPRHPGTDNGQKQRNVILHLPPGPSLGQTVQTWPAVDEQSSLLALASPNTTIVTINYRHGLSVDSENAEESTINHCFPTPIQDVAEGLHFLTSDASPLNDGQEFIPKISLLGSRLGGGLAAMLALTQPNDIYALTMIEPMVDWVGLDEVVKHLRDATSDHTDETTPTWKKAARKRNRALNFPSVENKNILAAAEELLTLRSTLFKTPSAYFDPFANPVLFLRAPGRDTPLDTAGDLLMRQLGIEYSSSGDDDSFGPYDDDWGQNNPSAIESNSAYTEQSPSSNSEAGFVSDVITPDVEQQHSYPLPFGASPQPRRRKVLRRWPSIGRPEDVLLPGTKFFLRSVRPPGSQDDPNPAVDHERGLRALLRAQGMEFAELMRRACFYGRDSGFANERVLVHEFGKDDDPTEFKTGEPSSISEQAVRWADQALKQD